MSQATIKRLSSAFFMLLISGGYMAIASGYPVGTLQRVGPGGCPMVLGGLGLVIGFLILVAPAGKQDDERFKLRPFLAIVAAILCFIGLFVNFGFIPAIIALIFVATLADNEFSFKTAVLTTLVITAIIVLIFIVGLRLPIPLVRY